MKNLITMSILFLFLCSCGPNSQEQAAALQRNNDSVANSVKVNIEQKQRCQNKLIKLNNSLINANADLVVANDEMTHIQGFQLFRLPSTRDEQIKNQSIRIQKLTNKINRITTEISNANGQLASYGN